MPFLTIIVLSLVESLLLSNGEYHYPLFFSFSFLVVAQYALLTSYNLFIYPFYISPLRHLPGPKDNHWFFGQTLKFVHAKSPNEVPLAFMRANPTEPLIRYFHIGNKEWLLVNSLQACRELLQTKCYDFEKPELFRRVVGEITGIGLVNVEGKVHQKQRRLLHGLLSIGNVRKIVPVFNDKAEELTATISTHAQVNSEAALEVSQLLSKTTLDIIGCACLGIELGSLSSGGSTFADVYHRIMDQPPASLLLSAINMFMPIRWLPVAANRDFVNATIEVRKLLRDIIRERRKEIYGSEGEKETLKKDFTQQGGHDFLTFMLHEKGQGEDCWSDDDILGHLLNFMSGGHDTSAGALTWALLTLCLQPSLQTRLRAEIYEHIGDSSQPTHAELDALSHMSNFLKEVSRCFSPSTIIMRTPSHAGSTICNTPIPTSTTLLINPQSIQFNPSIWGPDAETFDPDRHDDSDPRQRQYPGSKDPYAIEAFSNGPRICIGRAFANLEMKAVLVKILGSFEMKRGWDDRGRRLSDGEEYVGKYDKERNVFAGAKVKNFLTLRPESGVWVRFVPLKVQGLARKTQT